ncbi:MAG: prepilin-type N-terminal cleavage/methylation domain-containing protein [Acholeplasmataceae bacterium]|nr:prepilin-type N-terminal cleavage/methylation domain-containing protein [Acholeplasmataceae bacterium]
MKFFKNKKGFTLVELVVVIAILGILAGIAIPRFMDATASARGSKIVADLRTIDSAVSMYYAKTGAYPSAGDSSEMVPSYLAAWPTPGFSSSTSVIFPYQTTAVSVTSYTYTLDATSHLAKIGGSTAADLSAGGTGYTTGS